MQQATAHIVCYPFLHCRSVICIHLSQKSIFGSEKRHSSPSFTGNDNCPFQIESYVPLASAADCSHAVCCTFLHCTSVVCITCMPWRHSPALTHSLTAHGLTTMTWGVEASIPRPRDAIASFIVFLLQLFDGMHERMRYPECSRI